MHHSTVHSIVQFPGAAADAGHDHLGLEELGVPLKEWVVNQPRGDVHLGRGVSPLYIAGTASPCRAWTRIRQRWRRPIQKPVVQSIELQGNRGSTGKSRQNSRGTGRAKLAGTAPLMEVPL